MYPNEYLKNADVVIRDQMWLIYAVECEEEHIEGMLEYLNGTLNYESSLFLLLQPIQKQQYYFP